MRAQFEIESIFKLTSRKEIYVFAKWLNDIDFKLSDKTMLNDVPIEKYLDMPRALDKDGNPRLDLFAFKLKNESDREKLVIGQIVELFS